MKLIDSHCHLHRFASNGELDAVLSRAADAGVSHFVTVGTSAEDWPAYRDLSAAYSGRINYTVGLHPCDVTEGWEETAGQITSFFIPPHTPVAVGEIGLDFFHLPKDPAAAGEQILLQEAAFRHQLALARQLDCPVVIHSRDSFDECLRQVDESGIDWEKVVFHCFSNGPDEVRRLNERGGRASFTGILTYRKASEVREALRAQGIDRLMLETDCPYLSPEPVRGKTNEPAHLVHTATAAAEVLGIHPEELAERTTENVRTFFNLA